jgi:hypothetical protein
MPTVSGMFNTDAMNFAECPKCHQPSGKVCVDHRGKKLSQVHGERADTYRKQFKDRAGLYVAAPDHLEKVLAYNRKLMSTAERKTHV